MRSAGLHCTLPTRRIAGARPGTCLDGLAHYGLRTFCIIVILTCHPFYFLMYIEE